MNSLKQLLLSSAAFLCIASLVTFTTGEAAAQTKRVNKNQSNAVFAPTLQATLTDSFPDPDNDGKARAGDEVTYTATITNTGGEDALNVTYTNQIDSNTTLVPDSLEVQYADQPGVIRCTFNTAEGGSSSGCVSIGSSYFTNLGSNYMALSGQNNYLVLTESNPAYDSQTQKFSFDATLQNLLNNSFGTINGVASDAQGIKLFINSATVTSGTGSVTAANADGTGIFTAQNQPYFLYNQILNKDEVTGAKTLEFDVPNTAGTFTVDFLVYTRVEAKLVINEVMANPNGTVTSEQPLEWFEVYNAGSLPIDMQGLKISDWSASGYRPAHTIASSLVIPEGGYAVLGGSTNTTANGGAPVDYSYGTALNQLANSQDRVRILAPEYLDPTDGTFPTENSIYEIDRVQYANASISAKEGIARELKNPALDNSNMDGSNWGDASVVSVYGSGGRGTPKAQNSAYVPAPPPPAELKSSSFDSRPIVSITRNSESVQPLSGETVSVNLGAIPANSTATVTYKVTIANPLPAGTTQISAQATVAGNNFASFSTDDPDAAGASDATVTQIFLAPTAASVIVQGRVLTPTGRGLGNAQVMLTEASGATRHAITNPFGYYQFADVTVGQTVVTQVFAKRYSFLPQTVNVSGEILDLNFIAEP